MSLTHRRERPDLAARAEVAAVVDQIKPYLRSHLRIAAPDSPRALVSKALLAHLATLTPETLGLPADFQATAAAARIEARALADLAADAAAAAPSELSA